MRLIDADALKIVAQGKNHHRKYIWADITDAPTIEAEPVRRGRWEKTITYYPYCSRCEWMPEEDEMTHGLYNYCPNCGAKMESEVEE